jgi:hypothetical protein
MRQNAEAVIALRANACLLAETEALAAHGGISRSDVACRAAERECKGSAQGYMQRGRSYVFRTSRNYFTPEQIADMKAASNQQHNQELET